ncbi:MAG TPA: ABC transporter permease [Candidatus Kapabacteria bacterium]|jgi:phospholipid/cholesterol/gamma-HCH transport system permease protein|nr:ABC transporter permease [Candidatus Kapabacteria bacterium]
MKTFFEFLGRISLNFIRQMGEFGLLSIQVIQYFPNIYQNRRNIFKQMEVVGNKSLPLVILIGIFTGIISALEATSLFDKFNMLSLAKPFIGSSIATAIFTELSPVLTALVIAGRIGASVAAEVGTMQVTEQLDALEMMSIDRNRYLAMPRVMATTVMMPILVIFSYIVGLIGAYILTAFKFDFSLYLFFESVQRFFSLKEIIVGLIKSAVFGGVTSLIGIFVGYRTTGGAEGVGNSTVRAFTLSAAAILFIDALFGYFY